MHLSPRYDGANALYERGLSLQQVAREYGITRQAMYDILKRRGCRFRPGLRYGRANHFHRGGSRAVRSAQRAVELAIRYGRIAPQPCERCGHLGTMRDGRVDVQAHHDDYSRPLDVRWLFQPHHHEWHRNNRPKGGDAL